MPGHPATVYSPVIKDICAHVICSVYRVLIMSCYSANSVGLINSLV